MLGTMWLIVYCSYALGTLVLIDDDFYIRFIVGFWYGGKLVREENYKIGNVLLVFLAIITAIFNLGQAGPHFQALNDAKVAASIVWQVIDAPSKAINDSETGLKKDHLIGDIHFCNVHFSYPSRPGIQALNGISFDVKHGQTIALVGASGSGKSTCVQLLQRFYNSNSGSIIIDGNRVDQYNLKWLRQQIGVVSQEPILFQTTIRENILFGRRSATDEEVQEATKMANAHDFIKTLPEKYETLVGQRGAALSGGQKQRIAIARALIRDPKILLLDEATSALDNESEKLVQEALYYAAKGMSCRTTLVIAHRLSTIRNADKIVVMHKGEIVEEGNHDSLMHNRGIYYGFVEAQNLHMNEEEFERHEMTRPILASQVDDEHLDERTNRDSTMVNHGKQMNESMYEDFKANDEEANRTKKKEKKLNATLAMLIMNKPEWLFIAIGCIACICNGAIVPGLGFVLSKLIAVFQECDKDKQERRVLLYVLLFMGFGILYFTAMFLQSFFFAYSGETLTRRIRAKIFRTILRQEIAFFDDPNNSTGALCTRLANEASAVQGATGVYMGIMFQNIAALGTAIIIGFVFSWQLTAPDYGKATDAGEKIMELFARNSLIDNGSSDGDEVWTTRIQSCSFRLSN
ncbi:unnamed protein product [Rotaria sp. Silwood2]|nr:unnamed protein product [Rotaria sp. Silwood2]